MARKIRRWSCRYKSPSDTASSTRSQALLSSIRPPSTACSASIECGGTFRAEVCKSYCSGRLMSFIRLGQRILCWKNKGHGIAFAMQCPMLASLHSSASPLSSQLGGYNNNLNGCFNVAVQVHGYVVFAELTNGAVRQTHFSFGHFNARGGQGFSDVVSTDGAEQFAFIARGSGDGDFQFSQLSSAGFSVSFLLGSQFFQLGATRFKRSNVCRSSGSGFALRQQEVTTVTGLNIHFIAQVAQVGDFFQQDQFHLVITS